MHYRIMNPGGIVLSGHTDVVPIDGQDWQTDIRTKEKDGQLYGRGTCDMKAFTAIALTFTRNVKPETSDPFSAFADESGLPWRTETY